MRNSISRSFTSSLLWVLPGLILLISACTRDFVERDLAGASVTVLAPPDNYITSSNVVNFWWEETEGAISYRLQIVDSGFAYVTGLRLDTTVESEQFNYSLPPGHYQWRLRAENGSSQTSWSQPRSLRVDTTSNISTQSIILLSPSNNNFSNMLTQSFRWSPLGSANEYRFQVLNSQSQVIEDQIITQDSISFTFSPGTYTWRVRGQNSISNTAYSSRIITIDVSAPSAPALLLPTHGDTVANPAALSWTRDASATGDSLFVYPDSLISAPVYSSYLTATSYSYSGTSGNTYFWRLKSRDQAGNWSQWSVVRKFKIQ